MFASRCKWPFIGLGLLTLNASFAQEKFSLPDFGPPSEMTKKIAEYSITKQGADIPRSILMRHAFVRAYSTHYDELSEDDKTLITREVRRTEKTRSRANETINSACIELAQQKASGAVDIYSIASRVMQADAEAEEDLANHYQAIYEKLSQMGQSAIEKEIPSIQKDIRTSSIDLVGLSIEKPEEVTEILTAGCNRRQKAGDKKPGRMIEMAPKGGSLR